MNIVYLYPFSIKPAGGVKVAYKHSEMLQKSGLSSQILHSKNPKLRNWLFEKTTSLRTTNFSCSWFEHNASIRSPKDKINAEQDFIVIPEIWAAPYGDYLKKSGINYAIFVQGGYLIQKGQRYLTEADLKTAYENAKFILSISEDTTKIISLKYPFIESQKIIRLFPGVDTSLFSSACKEKLITYMPRRLPEHSQKLLFLLRDLLPADWRIEAIDNATEKEVAAILSRSSIFMSFCDQEGCPLPPLEAALSGNIVVGYTGQGANEYFNLPLFRKVENGNFIEFTKTVLQSIADIDGGLPHTEEVAEQVKCLKNTYSLESARTNLLEFGRRVQLINGSR